MAGFRECRKHSYLALEPGRIAQTVSGRYQPPNGSASTNMQQRCASQVAASPSAVVVTPGDPWAEPRHTRLTGRPLPQGPAEPGRQRLRAFKPKAPVHCGQTIDRHWKGPVVWGLLHLEVPPSVRGGFDVDVKHSQRAATTIKHRDIQSSPELEGVDALPTGGHMRRKQGSPRRVRNCPTL